ncbi:MAG: hypothetical protein ACJ8ES_15850 [Xanthobacteraceae bacterium]
MAKDGMGRAEATFMRPVDSRVFLGAPRFHSGVGPRDVPAIIRDDESVLTPGQMRALGRTAGGGWPVSVHITNAPPGTTAEATTSCEPGGGTRIGLKRHIDDRAAALVDSGQSAVNSSIERRYGLTPRL